MDYKSVSGEEFLKLMNEDDSFVIRAPIMSDAVLKSTDLVMRSNDLGDCENELPSDKNTKLLVYCRRGNASRFVCGLLAEAGYTNIVNLEGGMHSLGIEA